MSIPPPPPFGDQPGSQPGSQPPYGAPAPPPGSPQYGAPQYGTPQYGAPQYGTPPTPPGYQAYQGYGGAPTNYAGFGSRLGAWVIDSLVSAAFSVPAMISFFAGPREYQEVGSSRVDLQACKLEYSIVSPK